MILRPTPRWGGAGLPDARCCPERGVLVDTKRRAYHLAPSPGMRRPMVRLTLVTSESQRHTRDWRETGPYIERKAKRCEWNIHF